MGKNNGGSTLVWQKKPHYGDRKVFILVVLT